MVITSIRASQSLPLSSFVGLPPIPRQDKDSTEQPRLRPTRFSGLATRDIPAERWGVALSQIKPASPRFGSGSYDYQGPFRRVKIISDFVCQTSQGEVEDSLVNAWKFAEHLRSAQGRAQELGVKLAPWSSNPPRKSDFNIDTTTADIPTGNIDYGASSILRALPISLPTSRGGIDLPSQRPQIIVPIIDPGVGVSDEGHDRSFLVSKSTVIVGPNNGVLAAAYDRLKHIGDSPKIYQIDLNTVERYKNQYTPAGSLGSTTFHARDAFAIVAGGILGGIDPTFFATKADGAPKVKEPVRKPYTYGLKTNLVQSDDRFYTTAANNGRLGVYLDNTGLLKTDWALTKAEFARLRQQVQSVQLETGGQHYTVPIATKFNDVPQGTPLLYLGSTEAPKPGTYYLEVAINSGNAGHYFNIPRSPFEENNTSKV